MLGKEIAEIFHRNACVYIVVYLYGNANAVALANAKAAGKYNIVLKMMLFDGFLQKLHDLGGAFQMAGTANTN